MVRQEKSIKVIVSRCQGEVCAFTEGGRQMFEHTCYPEWESVVSVGPPLSLVPIKVTRAELMPSNLWCSITVNPMKPRSLCINQCHMFTLQ